MTTLIDADPTRKMSEIKNDSRVLYNAFLEEYHNRTIGFYDAVTLIKNYVHKTMDQNKKYNKDQTDYLQNIGYLTHKTLNKFAKTIDSLTPDSAQEALAAVLRHDSWLLQDTTHGNEREAGRVVTRTLCGYLTDLAKF